MIQWAMSVMQAGASFETPRCAWLLTRKFPSPGGGWNFRPQWVGAAGGQLRTRLGYRRVHVIAFTESMDQARGG